jgi:hypothetical protein
MTQKPGFDMGAWISERRPEFLPALTRLVTATEAVLRKGFGGTR